MFGSYTVWLDTKPEEDASVAPQREAYAQAEIRVNIGGEAAAVAARSLAASEAESNSTTPAAVVDTEGSFEDLVEGVVSQVRAMTLPKSSTVGPLIIESLRAKKGVSKGGLRALDDPLVVQTKI